jgi:RNA polymerase sigma-70 factor (ECF subfamily)
MMGNRQEAEDMSQESFLRGFDRLATFDPARPFGPWIRRVATNYCLNRLAVRRPITLPLEDEHEVSRGAPRRQVEQAAEAADRSREIREALMRLTPQYRAVVELRHFQELSYNEISQVLGISLPQVKSHLFRARKLLGEMLQEHE